MVVIADDAIAVQPSVTLPSSAKVALWALAGAVVVAVKPVSQAAAVELTTLSAAALCGPVVVSVRSSTSYEWL